MKHIFLSLILILAKAGLAQSISCSFSEIHQRRLLTDSRFAKDMGIMENEITAYIQSHKSARTEATAYTLPVVFHVIHNNGGIGAPDNPSDANILATLQLLNDAWSKNGAAYGGVDMEIKFKLATRSSSCGPTSGINRIYGGGTSDYATNGITTSGSNNEAAVKALSRWSSADYINIWIVTEIDGNNGTGSPGGFAYFPEHGDSQIDGLTIMASTVDGINKTIVHEMGHIFGLYHTFEGSSETLCAQSGDNDEVADTELSLQISGCPDLTSNTCTGVAFAIADVPHGYTVLNNFMGYTSCQWMFTAGQKDRARSMLELFRPGLIHSQAFTPAASVPASIPTLTSGHGLSPYYGVERVQFNTINIYSGTSVQDNGNYINRTCNQTTQVQKGTTYSLTVTSTYANPEYLRVYIDFNGDGDFEKPGGGYDTDEEVLKSFWESSKTVDVLIPNNAVTGVPLLMRVIADNDFLNPSTSTTVLNGNPTVGGGQAEDFTVSVSSALPVALIYFKGQVTDDQFVDLSWATTSEDNSQSFELEGGSSLNNMDLIASVDAAGNSTTTKNYLFLDKNPFPGINYYRLTEVDQNGDRNRYRAIAVEMRNNVTLYPNPSFNNQFYLKTSYESKIQLHSITGQEIACNIVFRERETAQVTARRALEPGIYLVSVESGGRKSSFRLLVP